MKDWRMKVVRETRKRHEAGKKQGSSSKCTGRPMKCKDASNALHVFGRSCINVEKASFSEQARFQSPSLWNPVALTLAPDTLYSASKRNRS